MTTASSKAAPRAGQPEAVVLVVDDDHALTRLIQRILQREGFTTASAGSGQEAAAWLAGNRASLMLLDLKLRDVEGRDLIRRLVNERHSLPFIVITGQGDERVAVEMMKQGAMDYLVKDVNFLQFLPEVVRRALDQIDKEVRLAAAEEQARLGQTIIEQGSNAVLVTNANTDEPRVVYVNPALTRLTGLPAAELIGIPATALDALGPPGSELRRALAEQRAFSGECALHSRDGERRIVDCHVTPVLDGAGKRTHWATILRDVTANKRLEQEVLTISESEQRRIGQDLHDGLGQHLAGIELMSQVLEQRLRKKPKADAEAEQADRISRHVREAIQQTRMLARGLSPVGLEADGLMGALRQLARNTESIFQVACQFECDPPVLVADHDASTHLFRIAQEAVSNAIKHGRAKTILIELQGGPRNLVLRVSDQGAGFPKETSGPPGMGLRIMQYRAGMLGGSLSIERPPNGGVRIVCAVEQPVANSPPSLP